MVNIEKVYQRVLFLANKEQRGYITPDEFNSYSIQAQLQIFDSYFETQVQAASLPMMDDDYADLSRNVGEKLHVFDNTGTITERSTSGGSDNVYLYPTNMYTLGRVLINGIIVDEVDHKDVAYINLSPLTAPNVNQPIYTRHEGGFVVYPLTYIGAVTVNYVRKPGDPIWAFLDDPSGEPIYDATNSTDFELHPSEEFNLVYSILTMAGVTIKQPDIVQYGAQNES